MRPYRLLVAGGRDFADYDRLKATVSSLLESQGVEVAPGRVSVISGMATGADTLGARWAREHGLAVEEFPAPWGAIEGRQPWEIGTRRDGKQYWKGAGHHRNRQMAESGPDAVLVFPGGRGTENMVKTAREMGLPVWDARQPNEPMRLDELLGDAKDVLEGRTPGSMVAEAEAVGRFLIDSKAPTELGRAFSPLNARLRDGRTIEEAYQQAKGYPDWRSGKGRPALTRGFDYEGTYQALYQQFADENPGLMERLGAVAARQELEHPRARTTQNPAVALTRILAQKQKPELPFTIVNSRDRGARFDVLGMREKGQTIKTVKVPGEPGWLGNPYKADDAGGPYTRQEATRMFGDEVYRRGEDPEWARAFQGLRGKAIGYYKPDEPFIHLQELARWLNEHPLEEGVPLSRPPGSTPPSAAMIGIGGGAAALGGIALWDQQQKAQEERELYKQLVLQDL